MKSVRAIVMLLLLAFAGVPHPAFAQALAVDDRDAIVRLASDLESDVLSGNYGATLDILPPPLLHEMASRFGMTEGELRTAVDAQVPSLVSEVTFVSFTLAIDEAPVATTPGRGRRYLLIPTRTELDIQGAGRVVARSHTLALQEAGKWYLVRIEDQSQVDMLVDVYPEFDAIEFEPGTIEATD